jgi:hypothetical protein
VSHHPTHGEGGATEYTEEDREAIREMVAEHKRSRTLPTRARVDSLVRDVYEAVLDTRPTLWHELVRVTKVDGPGGTVTISCDWEVPRELIDRMAVHEAVAYQETVTYAGGTVDEVALRQALGLPERDPSTIPDLGLDKLMAPGTTALFTRVGWEWEANGCVYDDELEAMAHAAAVRRRAVGEWQVIL